MFKERLGLVEHILREQLIARLKISALVQSTVLTVATVRYWASENC
jgi:hypothetical protein